MNLNSSKKKQIIIYIFFIILAFVTRYFLFEDRNSWHDEWHSIYVADPNISNKETLLRFYGDKGDDFLTEFYPPLYLFLLKLVFKFFGYIDDIGRYVSLFFGVLTIIFSINLFNIIGGRKNYIFVGLLVSFNLFLIWQSLEIRAHSMFVAISLLNIILFYKILYYKNILLKFFYFITSVFLLSLWPITGAIFFGKTIFILKNFFLNKEKNLKILFLFS